jgi:tRNA nucleotidyltransferase/poly(A) polymerase
MPESVRNALADALRVLRQARNEADYDVDLPSDVIAERTEDAVLLADFLMAHLSRFQ